MLIKMMGFQIRHNVNDGGMHFVSIVRVEDKVVAIRGKNSYTAQLKKLPKMLTAGNNYGTYDRALYVAWRRLLDAMRRGDV